METWCSMARPRPGSATSCLMSWCQALASALLMAVSSGGRILSDDESFALWRAAGRLPYPHGPSLRTSRSTSLPLRSPGNLSRNQSPATTANVVALPADGRSPLSLLSDGGVDSLLDQHPPSSGLFPRPLKRHRRIVAQGTAGRVRGRTLHNGYRHRTGQKLLFRR